jgi:hypothetical protein
MAAETRMAQRALMSHRAKIDLAVRIVPLMLLAALLVAVVLREPFRNGPPIRDDGAGYHAWTRAILKRDLSFCMWEGHADLISYVDPAREMCQNKYPLGLALLHFPFMAPLVDLTPGAPLISPAEHRMCLALGAATLWIIAALLTWAGALLKVPAWRSTTIVLVTLFGTGLFHYSTYDASFSHVHSGLCAALLLTLAIRERERGRPMPIALLVLCGFFIVAIRMTSAILLAELSLAYLLWNKHRLRDATLRAVLPAALGGVAAIAIQLAYNRYAVGRFTLSSYGEESFLFDRPMQASVVASYERGLVTYFPVFALALALGFVFPVSRGWTALLAAQTASLVVLYGYWHSWMLGGGFGHRGFVELGPLVAVVLFMALRELPMRFALLAAAASVSCGLVTLQVMVGYWRGSFPMGEATAEDYWKHLRMVESTLSGGTQCGPVHCSLLKWRCKRKQERELSPCSVNFGEPGNCTANGECAPIVAIRSLASGDSTPYVTAPPSTEKRGKPLVIAAARIGPWEKFMVVPAKDEPSEVRLRSLVTNRYVALRAVKEGLPATLAATAETAERAATFVRVGRDSEVSFRTSNAKYVSAPQPGVEPATITADAEKITARERFALEPTLP